MIPEGEITYAYDAGSGNLNNIMGSDSTLSFSYDGSLLTKAAWTGTIQGSVEYEYDNDFKVTSQTVNESDADNGLLTGTTLGNVTDSITYNSFGETDTYQATANGSAVFVTDYETGALGRIAAKTETVNGESHSYSYTVSGQ